MPGAAPSAGSGAQTRMWSCPARLVGKTVIESFSRYPGVKWRLSPAVCFPCPPTRGIVFIRTSPGSSLLIKGVGAHRRLLSWSPAREGRAFIVGPRPSPAAHTSNELCGERTLSRALIIFRVQWPSPRRREDCGSGQPPAWDERSSTCS